MLIATRLIEEYQGRVCIFVNKDTISGLQECFRFQNEYNKLEIELRVVQFWPEILICNHAFDLRPNCTPLSLITIIICKNKPHCIRNSDTFENFVSMN